MFDPVLEPSFRLEVAGLPDSFEVLAFTGKETISEPFVFDVDLLIDDPNLDLASLLYRSAILHIEAQRSFFHGQLHELVQRDHGPCSRLCQLQLRPKLACLSHRFSQRIFSARTVPQILDQVLKEHGITGQDRRFELSANYPPRDFCTQYRESDLQFLQRLCAQERVHYHFEHGARGHCVVFSDSDAHFPTGDAVRFDAECEQPAIRQFKLQVSERYRRSAEGHTDVATLRSGQLMPLSGHPVAECNQPWLLTHVEHLGSQDPVKPYLNQFRAIHREAAFASAQHVVKPRMHSLQRAWVVDVDEPRPDPSRPVAVQFDWLYQGEGATPSHCWLPVSAELDGLAVAQLSEGTEVVVSFIEGDPDQPLISGFLHTRATVENDTSPVTPEDPSPVDGVLQLLRTGEPLLLLCLMPGGGSFIHCQETLCACRAATRFGPGSAA
ncbi:type VI secretion system Vgr family protein [Pseudomonas sp. PB3P13]